MPPPQRSQPEIALQLAITRLQASTENAIGSKVALVREALETHFPILSLEDIGNSRSSQTKHCNNRTGKPCPWSNPEQRRAHCILAWASCLDGKPENAISVLERCYRDACTGHHCPKTKTPENFKKGAFCNEECCWTAFYLSRSLQECGRVRKSFEVLQDTLSKCPLSRNNPAIWNAIGTLYHRGVYQHRDALDAYAKALQLDGTRPEIWHNIVLLYAESDMVRAAVINQNNNGHSNFGSSLICEDARDAARKAIQANDALPVPLPLDDCIRAMAGYISHHAVSDSDSHASHLMQSIVSSIKLMHLDVLDWLPTPMILAQPAEAKPLPYLSALANLLPVTPAQGPLQLPIQSHPTNHIDHTINNENVNAALVGNTPYPSRGDEDDEVIK